MKAFFLIIAAILVISCDSSNEEVDPKSVETTLKTDHVILFTILPRDKQLDYVYEVGAGYVKIQSIHNDTIQGQFKFPFEYGFTSNKVSDLFLDVKAIAIRTCPVICSITVDGVVVAVDSIRREDSIKKVVYLRYKIVE